MASDRAANKVKRDGCPECGGNVSETGRHRVPGGIDWHDLECDDCDWSRRF